MPYARIKPFNAGAGYKLRSFVCPAMGIRMFIGPNLDDPTWSEVTQAQADHLLQHRVNRRDPASACKFDILPDEQTAKVFLEKERARRNKSEEGTSIDKAIPLDPSLRKRTVDRDATLEAQAAEIARLKAQLAAMQPAAAPAPAPAPVSEPEAPASEPEAAPKAATTLTSAFTKPAAPAAAKRPVPRQ